MSTRRGLSRVSERRRDALLLATICAASGCQRVEEPEAAARTPAEPAITRPVALDEVAVERVGGSTGAIRIATRGKLTGPMDASMYVIAKMACRTEAGLFVDIRPLEPEFELAFHQQGEWFPFEARFFADGAAPDAAACQLDFRVTSRVRDMAEPLATLCWSADAVRAGACEPELAAAVPPGRAPFDIHDVSVARTTGKWPLRISLSVRANEVHERAPHVGVKAACKVGTLDLVDLRTVELDTGPFGLQPGESVRRTVDVYEEDALALAGPLGPCDLTFTGESDRAPVARACWRNDAIANGACGAAVAPAAVGPLASTSLAISDVSFETRSFAGGSMVVVVAAYATVVRPIAPRPAVDLRIACTVGANTHEDAGTMRGSDLSALGAGESARLAMMAFTDKPLRGDPARCELGFVAGPFDSDERTVQVGKACVKGGRVGGC
jgi:hypothetical protein